MLYVITIGILGLIVGSFLNVVIYRLKRGTSILVNRSACSHCEAQLKPSDLVPVFSFLFLQGKCRYCKKKISWQYPIVESVNGVLYALLTWKILLNNNSEVVTDPRTLTVFLATLFIASTLVVIFTYDLKHGLILNKVLLVLLPIVIVYVLVNPALSPLQAAIGSVVVGGFFWLLAGGSSGKWMGYGDVKLGFLLGLILGWEQSLILLFISFILGSLVGIALLIVKRKKLKSTLPFGTFLAFTTVVLLVWGAELLEVSRSLLYI